MGDTRDAVDPVDAIADLQRKLDDLQGTMLARVSRCPTGTLEQTMLAAPKADTLLLNGATLQRADYPGLWQWVTDNNRVGTGLFGNGDGTTTFTLPDWRGLVGRMPTSGGVVGERLGADSITLSTAQLPSHTHGLISGHGVSTSYGHNHGSSGSHNNHPNGTTTVSRGTDGVVAEAAMHADGAHTHNQDSHDHGVTLDALSLTSVGSGSGVDVRQASVGLNWLIWT